MASEDWIAQLVLWTLQADLSVVETVEEGMPCGWSVTAQGTCDSQEAMQNVFQE